jgi:hypothetical protein
VRRVRGRCDILIMRLRTKLLLSFVGLVLMPGAAILISLYLSMVRHSEETAAQRLQDSVAQAARAMDDYIQTRGEDLRVLSLSPVFHQATAHEISAYLALRAKYFPDYKLFYHADNSGTIVAASSTNAIGQSFFKLFPALTESFRKAVTSSPDALFATELDDGTIQFCSGVTDRAGKTKGVLVGIVEARFLTSLIGDLERKTVGEEHAGSISPAGVVILTTGRDRSSSGTSTCRTRLMTCCGIGT